MLLPSAGAQGYVYSTFVKQYNPLRDSQRSAQRASEQQAQQTQQKQLQQTVMDDEDFDDLSLFVSGSCSLRSISLSTADSSSTLSTLSSVQLELESGEELVDPADTDAQQVCVRGASIRAPPPPGATGGRTA